MRRCRAPAYSRSLIRRAAASVDFVFRYRHAPAGIAVGGIFEERGPDGAARFIVLGAGGQNRLQAAFAFGRAAGFEAWLAFRAAGLGVLHLDRAARVVERTAGARGEQAGEGRLGQPSFERKR